MRLLVGLSVAVFLLAQAASAAILPLPSGLTAQVWEPGESYPGKSQADPRLDRPVAFWRAGLTLAEVFTAVKEQTGVEIGFWPPDDQNTRVRVHLYLNPDEPPSLRELMVQLQWATDCSFFVGGEPGEKTYCLMSTSVAGGAKASLQARVQAIWKAREGRWKEIGGKLDEYDQALDLSREELIERYQGRDDLMLLNVLDPARRAATQLTCRHKSEIQSLIESPPFPAEGGEVMGFGSTISAGDFTPEDIADLKQAFGLSEEALRHPSTMFDLSVETVGRLRVDVSPEYPQEARSSDLKHPGPYLLADLTDDFALSGPEELALRRALGERIPPDQEASYLKKLEQDLAAARREQERIRLEEERSLSPRAGALLRSTSLTLRSMSPDSPIAPWLAQEAVARATGMNVVSDGLLWSDHCSYGRPSRGEEKTAVSTALAVLDSFTHAPVATGLRRPSWEWGDAGDFLRFRTSDRDIWRAAMLPQEFLDWVDSLLEAHLPAPEVLAEQKRLQLSMPVGLVYMTRMLGTLSHLQMQFGANINYDDPTELIGVVRHQAVQHLLYGGLTRPKLTRFLASLSDSQWERIESSGLRCTSDLSPDQQELLTAAMQRTNATPLDLTDRVIALDREMDARGVYSVRFYASGPARSGRRSGWGWSFTYKNKDLQVDAVAPEPYAVAQGMP